MKLIRKIVNTFSASRNDLSESKSKSFEKLASPSKRRKTTNNVDEIPYQLIRIPIGTSVLNLNEQEYAFVRKRAASQLEHILRKTLKLSKKEAAKTIANLRSDTNDYIKPPDSENIFGCPLNQLPIAIVNPETQLPRVIVKVIHSFLSRGGFEQEGPFRVEGDKQQLAELVSGISQGYEVEGIDIDSFPIAVLAATIKRYLRTIPGSLIPKEATKVLVRLSNLKDNNLRSLAIQLVLLTLPYQHAKVFASTNLLLKACSVRENIHKMSAAALTVCFGPTLFDTGINLDLVSGANSLLKEFIENYSNYSIIPAALN
jgi:hypothetical protein